MALDLQNPSGAAAKIAVPASRAMPSLFSAVLASRRVSAQERTLFIERLAMLLETGMALHTALDLLRQQTPDAALKHAIGAILEDVLAGKPLSVALARHPEAFPVAYVTLVGAAEGGGFVPQVLAQILEMEDKRQKLRAMLTGALSYPAFLAAFSIGVIVLVLVVVFPKFADMFEGIRGQLPFSTVVLMALSDGLRQYWLPLAGATFAAAAGAAHWARSAAGKVKLDRLLLRAPLAGEIFVQASLIRLMRTMSTSLANGVSVVDTLKASREMVDNAGFREFMLRVEDRVTHGQGIAAAFREEPFIPLLVKQMISTGEETGNLAMVMGRIADFYERELARRIAAGAKLIEPAMLLVMGVAVGTIVISLILPIFKLAKAVN